VSRTYGPAQLSAARNALRAVTIRLDHARYHFGELRRLLREQIDDKLPERDIYDIVMVGEPDSWANLHEGLLKVEAHMIACGQAVHSIPDALAHVAYYAAGLNPQTAASKRIRNERAITLKNVMADLADGTGRFKAVGQRLMALAADPAYLALDATVNYGKHRGLPDPVLQLEPERHPAPYAMQFESFSYDGTVRPRVEVEALLAPAYATMSQATVEVGEAINAALR
jgi:hypothetical protein